MGWGDDEYYSSFEQVRKLENALSGEADDYREVLTSKGKEIIRTKDF